MKPSNIRAIGFRIIGGEDNGSLVAHFPKSLQEILEAIKAAREFLDSSDTKAIEVEAISMDGTQEYTNMLKKASNDSDFNTILCTA